MSRRVFGWMPDIPDFRDYSQDTPSVKALLEPGGRPSGRKPRGRKAAGLPPSADLRADCSPVEDQGGLGSCTANAGAGLIEYYERRAFGRHLEASRLFLYKTTRNLMKVEGDVGAYLRTTIGAMVLFGVPPEDHWPYDEGPAAFDREPPAFCYAFAQNFKTIQYFRHDLPGIPAAETLDRVKSNLVAGHPSMFGFAVYSSIEAVDARGAIPFPGPKERILGGHAVVAVGYDDRIEIKNGKTGGKAAKGALLVRNSWGESWGEKGYGWLPYEYVRRGLAEDFWSVLKKDWIDTGAFNE
jgi:C1A family cysteine protease